MSSFWNTIQQSAQQLVQSAQDSYTNMISYPETVQCTAPSCLQTTPVPAATFAWVCKNQHQNTPLDSNCTQCDSTKSESKKLGLYKPSVICQNPQCGITILLSETTIGNNLWSAMVTAPTHVEQAVKSTIESAKTLSKPPTIFSCRHCNSQLYTPTGPWHCSFDNCNTNNQANTTECEKCHISRFSAGVICSICSRSTPVAGIKLVAELESAFNNVQQMATTGYKYYSGETTAPCLTCHNAIDLQKEQVRLILGLGENEPVPGFDPIPESPSKSTSTSTTNNNTDVQPTRTADEEELFAKLNEEEDKTIPLTTNQPHDGQQGNNNGVPIPQDVLCQKCLHLNTISKEMLVSRKITTPQQQQSSQPSSQPSTQQSSTFTSQVPIQHVDENGNPIKCIHCNHESTMLTPVIPCQTCKLNYCRKCAPYIRQQNLVCYGCATSYDLQQQQQSPPQLQQQPSQQPTSQPQQQDITQQQSNDPYEQLQ